jgi:hypothetical protein
MKPMGKPELRIDISISWSYWYERERCSWG